MTSLLASPQIKTIAGEESVRGVLVRMVMEQAQAADHDESVLLEDALRLLLTRFQVMGDDAS